MGVADDDLRETRQRLLDFANTATAEEGWCYMCGDLAADFEAPALTRLRATLAKVAELHRRVEGEHFDYCAECDEREGWPCPTAAALDGATT